MQSDAFPTPPIYSHSFQPRLVPTQLVQPHLDPQQDHYLDELLSEIELLIKDSSIEESKSFWLATDRLKVKHRVTESMQKIESLFLDLAKESTQDPDLIAVVAESLRYAGHAHNNSQTIFS